MACARVDEGTYRHDDDPGRRRQAVEQFMPLPRHGRHDQCEQREQRGADGEELERQQPGRAEDTQRRASHLGFLLVVARARSEHADGSLRAAADAVDFPAEVERARDLEKDDAEHEGERERHGSPPAPGSLSAEALRRFSKRLSGYQTTPTIASSTASTAPKNAAIAPTPRPGPT